MILINIRSKFIQFSIIKFINHNIYHNQNITRKVRKIFESIEKKKEKMNRSKIKKKKERKKEKINVNQIQD